VSCTLLLTHFRSTHVSPVQIYTRGNRDQPPSVRYTPRPPLLFSLARLLHPRTVVEAISQRKGRRWRRQILHGCRCIRAFRRRVCELRGQECRTFEYPYGHRPTDAEVRHAVCRWIRSEEVGGGYGGMVCHEDGRAARCAQH